MHWSEHYGIQSWYESLTDMEKDLLPSDVPLHKSAGWQLQIIANNSLCTFPDFAARTAFFALSLPKLSAIDRYFLLLSMFQIIKTLDEEKRGILLSVAIDSCEEIKEWENGFRREVYDTPDDHAVIEYLIETLEEDGEHIERYIQILNDNNLSRSFLGRRARRLDLREKLREYVLENPGCLQSDISITGFDKMEIRYSLKIHPGIKRERKGRTYSLFVNN